MTSAAPQGRRGSAAPGDPRRLGRAADARPGAAGCGGGVAGGAGPGALGGTGLELLDPLLELDGLPPQPLDLLLQLAGPFGGPAPVAQLGNGRPDPAPGPAVQLGRGRTFEGGDGPGVAPQAERRRRLDPDTEVAVLERRLDELARAAGLERPLGQPGQRRHRVAPDLEGRLRAELRAHHRKGRLISRRPQPFDRADPDDVLEGGAIEGPAERLRSARPPGPPQRERGVRLDEAARVSGLEPAGQDGAGPGVAPDLAERQRYRASYPRVLLGARRFEHLEGVRPPGAA